MTDEIRFIRREPLGRTTSDEIRSPMKRWLFLCILLAGMVGGCGTVGPPIPPEDTAIAVKLQKAKEKEKEKAAKAERKPEEVAPMQDEVPLPSTRPIGTR
jgi:predicted small lipoprotein YifL